MRFLYSFVICWALLGCSDEQVDPTPVESEFLLDGTLYKIESKMYWQRVEEPGEEDQIRLMQKVSEGGETDMIVVIPVLGSGKLEGSYIFSKTGDNRTGQLTFPFKHRGLRVTFTYFL